MQITLGSTITVEHPSIELVAWCKENLTITNPEYAQKMRMHLWLGNTPRYLALYETRGTTLILPFGVLRRVMQFIGNADVQTDFPQGTAINYGCSVPLYDYQEEAVDAVIRNHFGILQSPAGSGKTQMGIAAVAKLGKRTLWLTHTKDLLTQSKSRAELYMDSALLGTITEGKVNIGEGITFATIQTMGRSVCVSGQLFLLELASRYVEKITTLRLIQLNTDGVMVSLEDWELPILTAINDEWQQRTGFLLEEDVIQKIVQKDVNNYIEIKSDGSAKTKGGYLVRGIAPAGAFNINNNAVIVAKAIREFFVNGTPVEETIGGCDDIFQFQLIAKAGAKYREAYHLVDGEQQSVQKVNRVYATSDTRYGKLFKVKAEDDATAKIEMLPEHCIIDNDNHLTIEDVDKTFYIEMAKKRINDFLGIKPEKKTRGRKTTDTPKEPRRKSKMATAKTTAPKDTAALNAFQKVLMARVKFLEAGAKKTGKNMSLSFRYFELDDIIPVATPIFMELGLLPVVTFTEEVATMTIVNTDKPEDSVVFFSPMRVPESNRGTNPVMALGSAHTYLRRYL